MQISNAAASAAADAVVGALNGGTIEIRSGAAPANADAADAGVVLAVLALGNPAFGAAVNGVAAANAVNIDPAANATGAAAHFRAKTAGGVTRLQGTVGAVGSGADMELNTVNIEAGVEVAIDGWNYTQPK